jgi:hypothetical protein
VFDVVVGLRPTARGCVLHAVVGLPRSGSPTSATSRFDITAQSPTTQTSKR